MFNLLTIFVLYSCRIREFCFPVNLFRRINPDNQLIIEANCTDGCIDYRSIDYNFTAFINIGTMENVVWQVVNETINSKYLTGLKKNTLTFSKS